MPWDIDLGMPPAGYSVTGARAGERFELQQIESTSTEDGQHFIKRLEGLPSEILAKLPAPAKVSASYVDNMLAICYSTGRATVYVNEVAQIARVRVNRRINKSELVNKSDIADIDTLELSVPVPPDAGFLFLFSVGWRKGLVYDFEPIGQSNPPRRAYDVARFLGQAYCHVLFQERFSLSDDDWTALFASKWFPFAGLRDDTINDLIAHVRAGWGAAEVVPRVAAELNERLPQTLESWRALSVFGDHVPILERAVERFQQHDYASCTALLFPRIEGILRTNHARIAAPSKPTPENLIRSAVATKIEREKSLLHARRFAQYLTEVFFANFNPEEREIALSRHSVAHGVADAAAFNQESALLAILVVNQLFYMLDDRE
jgi:hypothetical protein